MEAKAILEASSHSDNKINTEDELSPTSSGQETTNEEVISFPDEELTREEKLARFEAKKQRILSNKEEVNKTIKMKPAKRRSHLAKLRSQCQKWTANRR